MTDNERTLLEEIVSNVSLLGDPSHPPQLTTRTSRLDVSSTQRMPPLLISDNFSKNVQTQRMQETSRLSTINGL